MKKKYQWNDSKLKQRAKWCQWAMLVFGFVGVATLFTDKVPILIGVLVALLFVNIYASNLRKKDRMLRRSSELRED